MAAAWMQYSDPPRCAALNATKSVAIIWKNKESKKNRQSLGKSILSLTKHEWTLLVSLTTAVLFFAFGEHWLAELSHVGWFALMFCWLFGVILLSALSVVYHAESLAVICGEPIGTLILTVAVTAIEVMMIGAVMATGHGNVTLARDSMFAVIMIVLNGMVGLCLLLGGLRYREQTYNLQGTNSFLAVIVPLAVLGLVLDFTTSSPGPTLSPLQATFLIIMSVGLYGVFLAIQTSAASRLLPAAADYGIAGGQYP